MAISKPPPLHFTFFHNQDSSIDTSDSNLALSIDTSRRRRDVLLTISSTLIPQLFFFDRKRSSSANAADFFNFGAPPPEPERTVELAQEGLRKNAENIKRIKEIMIEKKLWKEGGKELRRSASNMKQDFYLIIQAKPPKDRPLFRSLYSSLFNSITKMDYAARDGDETKVLEYYMNIVAILDDIFPRI
ncbi:PsbQ-like domain superfamily [Arabidopsis suecica]|uniref:PsbQ-like domain superfamily n=1 Tax=Arabidopsis suecica TaxID=45249 RepID=A0A8T2FYD1_ARASU|nr:PsbQ-like domain superfamily [Arabidopsis suecica]